MKVVQSILIFLGSIAVHAQTPEPQWQQAFMLPLGESIVLEENARLLFEAVTDDSRCPPDMECYWPGEATLVLRLNNEVFQLKIGGFDILQEASQILIADYYLKILWLSQDGNYRAVLMVTSRTET